MQLTKKDMERLFWIFTDYVESCDKSAGKFLNRIYNEIDEDCMKYGYKNERNDNYCDVSDRFNYLSGEVNHNKGSV